MFYWPKVVVLSYTKTKRPGKLGPQPQLHPYLQHRFPVPPTPRQHWLPPPSQLLPWLQLQYRNTLVVEKGNHGNYLKPVNVIIF